MGSTNFLYFLFSSEKKKNVLFNVITWKFLTHLDKAHKMFSFFIMDRQILDDSLQILDDSLVFK